LPPTTFDPSSGGDDNLTVDDRTSRLPAFLAGRPKPYLMAHRGASDQAPENSRAAFQLAIDAGVDLIETDLWFTADRQIVCHHDATLDRMTGTPGRVDQLTLAEVQRRPLRSRFDHRFPNERIVSLEELLALVPPTIVLALELKDPKFADPNWARLLTHQLEERLAATSVIVISFALERVLAVRTADPRTPTGLITLRDPRPRQPVDVLGPFWPLLLLNPFYVRRAHALGKWVCPLDLAAHHRLGWYRRLGVDAILTNDPAETARLLGRRAPGNHLGSS
jgi:glycerophosphoryl diester phosphodiesterase